jgi:YVTN family beta-propeller protein
VLVVLFAAAQFAFSQSQAQSKMIPADNTPETARTSQTYTKEGVSVEFSIEPLASGNGANGIATSAAKATGINGSAGGGASRQLLSGTDATVRFKITDTSGAKLLTNLRPAVWIDQRVAGKAPDAKDCREKVQSFLQQGFSKRATVDLNSYFILTLNNEPNISVIDPLSGFGGSKLFTLVALRGPGEDWVMSADKKRLYVSMPLANQVAVVDTSNWNVIANIDAGAQPTRIALQPDNRYLWVANGGANEKDQGVTVIDTLSLKTAAQIQTGAGPHEIAFADDDSLAFVTNKQNGTLSVIDIRKLARLSDLKVGSQPVALAFSPLSKAVYVANEGDGTIAVVDGSRREVMARMTAEPGLRSLRLLPDGRYGFAVNSVTNKVYVFDLSANRIVHAVAVGPGSDQVAFTRDFAYVRAGGSEFVTMIKISDLGKEAAVSRFPAGEKAPKTSASSSLADAIVPAPEAGAVLVANPADKMIYYYAEGMAAPMGSFQNYRRDPKAVLVLDNSLRETAGGVYTSTVRLPAAGHYDVAFLLDTPRLVTCFDLNVAENSALPGPAPVAIKIEHLAAESAPRVGETFKLRVRVTDSSSGQVKQNLADLGLLVFLAPGIWQHREWAKGAGEGIYELSFVPPQAGVYYVYFQCPSLGVPFNKITPLTLRVTAR